MEGIGIVCLFAIYALNKYEGSQEQSAVHKHDQEHDQWCNQQIAERTKDLMEARALDAAKARKNILDMKFD